MNGWADGSQGVDSPSRLHPPRPEPPFLIKDDLTGSSESGCGCLSADGRETHPADRYRKAGTRLDSRQSSDRPREGSTGLEERENKS